MEQLDVLTRSNPRAGRSDASGVDSLLPFGGRSRDHTGLRRCPEGSHEMRHLGDLRAAGARDFRRCPLPKTANSIRPVLLRIWIHGRGNRLEGENDAEDDLRLLWP
jgi:hypothetical protein